MKFKDYFLSIKESPDTTIKQIDELDFGNRSLGWRNPDARTFIVTDDFICISKTNECFHHHMYKDILSIYKNNQNHKKSHYIIHGTPSVLFLSQLEIDDRVVLVKKYPNWIQGRIWLEHKYISFWNHGINVRNNLQDISLMIQMLGEDPDSFEWEIDNEPAVSFNELKNTPNIDGELPKTKDDKWQQVVHELPPEKKGNALRAMGVKPKAPLGAAKRFAMGESFKDLFNILLEKNYSYNIPQDKELLLYDFYMLVHLTALEKEGKFEPGDKVDPYGQGIETKTRSMGVRDSTKHSFDHIKTQVIEHLQPALLEAALYSVSCEFRHVFDRNSINKITDKLGAEAGKFCQFFQYNFAKFSNKSVIATSHPEIRQHVKNRREEFNTKHNIKMKEKGSSNIAYNNSYKAVKKSLSDINKGKSSYESMTEEDFITLSKKCFESLDWNGAYGGTPWASICDAYIKLKHAKNETDKIIFIDNMYHQQHNTDTVFNKIQSYCKKGSFRWVLDALNFKADVRDNWDRITKIKQTTNKNGISYLRNVDRMYIELLKASGDDTYESYYNIKKPEKIEKQDDVKKIKSSEESELSDSSAIISYALSRAFVPWKSIAQGHTVSALKNLKNDPSIFYLNIIYVGCNHDLINQVDIDENDLYYFVNNKWVHASSASLNGAPDEDFPKAITSTKWSELFGKEAYQKLVNKVKEEHSKKDEKEPEQSKLSPPDLSGISAYDEDDEDDASAKESAEWSSVKELAINLATHFLTDDHEKKKTVVAGDTFIPIGYGSDLFSKVKRYYDRYIPDLNQYSKYKIYWYSAAQGGEWIYKEPSEKFDKHTLYAFTKNEWKFLFGTIAWTKVQQAVKEYNEESSTELKKVQDEHLINKAVAFAQYPFEKGKSAYFFLRKNPEIINGSLIYMGIIATLIKAANIPEKYVMVYQQGEWKPIKEMIPSHQNAPPSAISAENWKKVFGENAYQKISHLFKKTENALPSDVVETAMIRATVPWKNNTLQQLRNNKAIQEADMLYLELAHVDGLCKHANIPDSMIYWFIQDHWVPFSDIESNVYEKYIKLDTPKGIGKYDWINIFGRDKYNLVKTQINQLVKDEEGKSSSLKNSSPNSAAEAIARAFRPWMSVNAYVSNLKKNKQIQSLEIIYIGIGDQNFFANVQIPKENIWYYNSVNDMWSSHPPTTDLPDLLKGIGKNYWIELFGQKAFNTLKEKVKPYLPDNDTEDYIPTKNQIGEATFIGSYPFMFPLTWKNFLRNSSELRNTYIINVGTGSPNGIGKIGFPSDYILNGYECEYDVNAPSHSNTQSYKWNPISAPVSHLRYDRIYALPYTTWIKLFGERAYDKIKHSYNSYKGKSDVNHESFKNFFANLIKENIND